MTLIRKALLIALLALPLSAQQGFHLDPVVSAEAGGLFNAAGEASTTIDISIGDGTFSGDLAVQAFASAGTSVCTYFVKGSLRAAPTGTEWVDLTAEKSCLGANDERLHFFNVRLVRSLQISLGATLTGGTSVTFAIQGMAR